LLSPYADDALGVSERKVVAAHLGACAACTARLGDLEALRGAISAYVGAETAAVDFTGFGDAVLSRIQKEPLGLMQRLRLGWAELTAYHGGLVYSAMGAAAVAVAVIAVLARRPVHGGARGGADMVVHNLSVSDPNYESVVMHTDDGESVIMVVQRHDKGAAPGAPAAPSGSPPAVPHGGNL